MYALLEPHFDPAKASFDVLHRAEATVPVRSIFADDPLWTQANFVTSKRVPYDALNPVRGQGFTLAGPPEKLMCDPREMTVAIVTCGGLCPGLNDVIRGLTLVCIHLYQFKEVLGVRYGYPGIEAGQFTNLDAERVDNIHNMGGTILGSARGIGDMDAMIDQLKRRRVDILFCVGGDGTLRGASAISDRVRERGMKLTVVGVPKTIDNDIPFVQRSFGFASAVEEARKVLTCAHAESKGSPNGIGLVKLMGRHAGFICANATLASGDVNFCLVPEDKFAMPGFLKALEKRMDRRNHAVIAVAEGLASQVMPPQGHDPSGNPKLGDVGPFLRGAIEKHFKDAGKSVVVKYFDPSYSVRSIPANSDDSTFCWNLSRQAVFGAVAGLTDFCVGHWNGYFTYVPLATMHGFRKTLDLRSELWHSVLSITGQPCDWTA